MADIVSPDKRSRMMSGIKGKNTRLEVTLRKGLYARGFRYRIHGQKLPGKPDLVFRKRNAVIFAHGCFWHGHNCHLFRLPSTRTKFWQDKIRKNVERDVAAHEALASSGWRIGVVWECAIKGRTRIGLEKAIDRCAEWLESEIKELEVRGQD